MKRLILITIVLLVSSPLLGQGMDFSSGEGFEFGEKKVEKKKLTKEELAREAEEARELEKDLPAPEKREGVRGDIVRRESKPRQREVYFHFLSPRVDAGYHYLGSYDFEISHLLMLRGEVTLLGLNLEHFEGYVGQIGYQIAQKSGLHAFTLTPASAAFRWRIKNNWNALKRHVTHFNVALECSFLTFIMLRNHISTTGGDGMSYLLNYFTLRGRYDFYRSKRQSWNLYLSFAIGPEDVDHQDSGIGVIFSLGFSGNFYPLLIQLREK